jgi:hypothetical protein
MSNFRQTLGHIVLITVFLAFSGCNAGTSDRAGGEEAMDQQAGADQAVDQADYPANKAAAIRPGDGPGTYEIAGGADSAIVPFEFYGMNLLIHAEMNGRKVKLLIDNGRLWDETWFYDGEADSLGIRYLEGAETGTVVGSGEDGGSDIHEGHPVDLDLGSVKFFDQPALISPPEAGFGAFFPGVAGQVSSMLFEHFVVTFDFDENVIILTKPEAFDPTGAGTPVPMRLAENGAYVIPMTIGMPGAGELDLQIDIDLGGIYPLHFIENEALGIVRPEDAEKKHLGYGASGEITGYVGQIDMARIGGHTLNDVTAVFTEEGANVDIDIVKAGTVGLPLFKRFNITFDYFNGFLYADPNASSTDPFE